jgi:hypothetical protein
MKEAAILSRPPPSNAEAVIGSALMSVAALSCGNKLCEVRDDR